MLKRNLVANKEKQTKKAKSYLENKPFKVIYQYEDLEQSKKSHPIKEVEYPEYIPSIDDKISFDDKWDQILIVTSKYFNEPKNTLYIVCVDSKKYQKYQKYQYPNNLK